ncbi:MAG: hypothetical protein LC808_40560, partial [Actinobacteria bacterium]|nr:hypothetical protein [Actinomycetota bacterium]
VSPGRSPRCAVFARLSPGGGALYSAQYARLDRRVRPGPAWRQRRERDHDQAQCDRDDPKT